MHWLQKKTVDFRLFRNVGACDQTYEPGQTIVSENSPGTFMYVIRAGTAEVRANGELIEKIGPGGIFGEMALIDHSARSASVVARDRVIAIPIDEQRFIRLVAEAPHFALNVMRTLVKRIRRMNERGRP
jgi:CRP-like cAMP-binding protein